MITTIFTNAEINQIPSIYGRIESMDFITSSQSIMPERFNSISESPNFPFKEISLSSITVEELIEKTKLSVPI